MAPPATGQPDRAVETGTLPWNGQEQPDDYLLYASPTRKDHIGRIVIPVMVNGSGPFRFIVDTGASYSTVTPQLAKALGLEVSENASVLVNGITGTEQVASVLIDSLEAGDVVFRNVNLPVVWAPVMAGADGFLGIAGLKTERIMVEFLHNRVTISKSYRDRVPIGFQRIHGYRMKSGLLSIDAKVGGIRTLAVIDTGAQRSLGNLALRDALGHKYAHATQAHKAEVYGTTSQVAQGEIGTAPLIEIGPVDIAEVSLIYGDFHIFEIWKMLDRPALIIGMDVLGTVNSLGIDFRSQDVFMEGRYLGTPAYLNTQ